MDLEKQAQMSKKKTEDALSDAFSFLVSDYNYKEEAVTFGPSHFRAFTKVYGLGGRSIEFSGDYDRIPFYDLVFHPVDMQARQELHPSRLYFHTWFLSIRDVIKHLGVEVSLPHTGALEDVAPAFSDALRSHAIRLVEGDFSIFPPVEFIVEQVPAPHERGEILGRYSTIEEAERRAFEAEESMEEISKELIQIAGKTADQQVIDSTA